jgi:hypothetical protein
MKKGKIYKLAMNSRKDIIDLCRGINELKRGYKLNEGREW